MAKQEPSQRFGKCLVEREIGRGARSVVYLAWHEGLQIPVAVKADQVVPTLEAEFFERASQVTRG